jgi:hypothetical protein
MRNDPAKLAQQQMAMQLFQAIREGNIKQQQLGLMQQNMIQDAMLAKRQNRAARETAEDRLAFEQAKMQQEGSNAMRDLELRRAQQAETMGFNTSRAKQETDLANQRLMLDREKLQQDKALAETSRAHEERMAQLRAEGYMNPAVLEALSGLSGLPPQQQELLLQQIEALTGKVLPKPVNQFNELIQSK